MRVFVSVVCGCMCCVCVRVRDCDLPVSVYVYMCMCACAYLRRGWYACESNAWSMNVHFVHTIGGGGGIKSGLTAVDIYAVDVEFYDNYAVQGSAVDVSGSLFCTRCVFSQNTAS